MKQPDWRQGVFVNKADPASSADSALPAARIRALFEKAAELCGADRSAFLAAACGDDRPLQARVEALLAFDDGPCALDRPAFAGSLDPAAALHCAADSPSSDTADLLAATPTVFPDRIGSFRVIGLIGTGGMGVVYRAQQEHPRRVVALKTLRPGKFSESARRRFEVEANTLARFQHPCIATIYEAGVDGGASGTTPYLAMELVEGRALLSAVETEKLNIRDRLRLFVQIASAVEYAHQRGVIHRDLKPANILVVEEREGVLRPKIVDFGIAQWADEDGPGETTGYRLGTPAYMAPELFSGRGDIDTRADVYAMGVVLRDLLGGGSPERGERWDIVRKATALDPRDRYPSMSALREDVERYLAGRPLHARPRNPLYAARKFAQRYFTRLAIAATAAVCLTWPAVQSWHARSQYQARALQSAAGWLDEVLRMQKTIGQTTKRGPLMERLVAEVQELAALAPGDSRVRSMQAKVATEMGYVDLMRADSMTAMRWFEQALRVRSELLAESPADAELRLELSLSIVRIGDAAAGIGDNQMRRQCYEDALQMQLEIAQAAPAFRRVWSNLGWSYERMAGLLPFFGPRWEEREQWIRLQARMFEQLVEDGEANADELRGLTGAYRHLSEIALLREECQEALLLAERAIRFAVQARALAPDDRLVTMAAIHAQLAYDMARQEQLSTREYTAARAAVQERAGALYASDPNDEDARNLANWTIAPPYQHCTAEQ